MPAALKQPVNRGSKRGVCGQRGGKRFKAHARGIRQYPWRPGCSLDGALVDTDLQLDLTKRNSSGGESVQQGRHELADPRGCRAVGREHDQRSLFQIGHGAMLTEGRGEQRHEDRLGAQQAAGVILQARQGVSVFEISLQGSGHEDVVCAKPELTMRATRLPAHLGRA